MCKKTIIVGSDLDRHNCTCGLRNCDGVYMSDEMSITWRCPNKELVKDEPHIFIRQKLARKMLKALIFLSDNHDVDGYYEKVTIPIIEKATGKKWDEIRKYT
jgi:hypothetical protein